MHIKVNGTNLSVEDCRHEWGTVDVPAKQKSDTSVAGLTQQ